MGTGRVVVAFCSAKVSSSRVRRRVHSGIRAARCRAAGYPAASPAASPRRRPSTASRLAATRAVTWAVGGWSRAVGVEVRSCAPRTAGAVRSSRASSRRPVPRTGACAHPPPRGTPGPAGRLPTGWWRCPCLWRCPRPEGWRCTCPGWGARARGGARVRGGDGACACACAWGGGGARARGGGGAPVRGGGGARARRGGGARGRARGLDGARSQGRPRGPRPRRGRRVRVHAASSGVSRSAMSRTW